HSPKGTTTQTPVAGHPPATEPFQHWQVDFVELTQAEGGAYLKRISSDNGTPFVHQGLIELTKHLRIDMKKHCSYHPVSTGAVEQANGTLKVGLAKMCQQTGLN
ncbi:hypothetical protein P4O66_011333, partial [Electrophorus voltai]